MRVRVDPLAATPRLVRAVEGAGGRALLVGQTLELVHPSGRVERHGDVELSFFVRSWVASSPDVAAHILDRRSTDGRQPGARP